MFITTETYAENSRIPVMSFGTPEEDAMRRDLTINSLFYNIHSKEVEDYSKRGVQDLKAGKEKEGETYHNKRYKTHNK